MVDLGERNLEEADCLLIISGSLCVIIFHSQGWETCCVETHGLHALLLNVGVIPREPLRSHAVW